MKKRVILLSSFVPANNSSPVSVNSKMVRLCCEAFLHTELVTANFPIEAVKDISPDLFTLTNTNVDFSSESAVLNIFKYIKMQFEMIQILRKRKKNNTAVIFWLSGPLILPFLYCKVSGFYTVGFLYGNSRKKTDRITLFNLLKAKIMEYIAKESNLMCIEAPSVATHWGLTYDSEKMQIVHLYVDTEKFSPDREFTKREKKVGMCCRLVNSKRVLESIHAFHNLSDKFSDYSLEIIGSGPLMGKCKQLIRELGEEDRIKLLGWVDNNELPNYMRTWRLILSPTNYEGIPNVLLEAMACGTPVLISPVGGISDVVRHGIEGWLLPDNSIDTIRKWLEKLLSKQDLLEVASLKSRERIIKKYGFEPALKNFYRFANYINTNGDK